MKICNKKKVSSRDFSGLCKRLLSIALVIVLITPAINVSFAYDILDTNAKNTLNNSANEINKVEDEVEIQEEGVLFEDAFDDEIFKDYIRSKIFDEDINENTLITHETFKHVVGINIEKKGLKSLKGIEYFGSLQYLTCGGNKIEKVDLSKNKKLYAVLLSENSISNIILPENANIEYLGLWGNKLKDLTIPDGTNINRLNIAVNEFTTFVLPDSNTTELYCNENDLTKLDVSKGTALKYLDCAFNKLTELDLSKCTKITKLRCIFNNLRDLDLSKNVNLEDAFLVGQKTEYELTGHNNQYSIFIGRNTNTNTINYKTHFEVTSPSHAVYTSDGYIDLGNYIIFYGGYAHFNSKFERTYEINGRTFTMDITSRLKKSEEPEEPEEEKPPITQHLNGVDRFDTSIKISKNCFTTANNVVLVNDSSLPDALSVTPYAKVKNAPILLTKNNVLNTKTRNEIERLNAKNIYIIGGENSVNTSVEKELKKSGYRVERISGEDRYITSLNIAKELNKHIDIKEAVVVNGVKGIPDAVSAAGISAQKGMPVLLTSETYNLNNITSFLNTAGVNKSYIVGGTKLFPTDISEKLPSPINIYGSDRNETNIKVINNFYYQSELNNAYICKNGMLRQDDLIDALSVGVLSAKNQSPVMLVGNSLDNSQKELVNNKKFKVITQVGGNGNENAFNELKNLLK